jgi:hypothetical protein
MYPKLSRILFIALLIFLFQIDFATAQAIPSFVNSRLAWRSRSKRVR